jgi:uncharacterized protein
VQTSSNRLFGRGQEVTLLDAVYASGKAELVALYGRRRVGKTYLIREYFAGRGSFYCEFTGQKDAPLPAQLAHFREALESSFYGGRPIPRLHSWGEAFSTLAKALAATIEVQKIERAVIFLDELPWMAAPKSGLIQALDHNWNTQFSKIPEVIVVVCGSAASWMLDNLIHAKGGLHNRITRQIRLLPFTLPEVRDFLGRRNIRLALPAVIELYMAIGGVPHYLDQLDKRLSVGQNIATLCFSNDGILRTEFTTLFRALFGESDIYERIVRVLAAKRAGVTRTELLAALKAESGGSINRRLRELEKAGFIARISPYGKRKKNTLHRIVDPYVYFYLSWIEHAPSGVFRTNGEKYWLGKRRTPAYAAWASYTFENICLTHVQWIQKALRLDHISFEVGSWCFVPAVGHADRSSAQIDLLFDRDDQVISLCEIKYNAESFSIDKSYARELKRKIETFQSVTRTRKNLQLVLITLNALKPNIWSEGLVDVSLSAEEIFGSLH